MDNNEQQRLDKEFQEKINQKIGQLSQAADFKDYFKLQREIIQEHIGTWKYAEMLLEKDAFEQYNLLIKSFGEKAKLDKENKNINDEKFKVIDKFNKQILESFEKKDYVKTSQQLFYVLLGNVLEHVGKEGMDMEKFDIQKDLYPHLKYPLGLAFFLFQNLTFGPIADKINKLSQEYLNKYSALLLCLWRTVFDLMQYEKQMEQMQKQEEKNEEILVDQKD